MSPCSGYGCGDRFHRSVTHVSSTGHCRSVKDHCAKYRRLCGDVSGRGVMCVMSVTGHVCDEFNM